MRTTLLRGCLFGCLFGCTGAIGSAPGEPSLEPPGGPQGPGAPPTLARCDDAEVVPSATPLRRLTSREYRETLATLFAPVALPSVSLAEVPSEFDTDVSVQGVDNAVVESARVGAEEVATAAVADPRWLGCDVEREDCVSAFVDEFAPRLLRRQLSEAESDRIALALRRNDLGGPQASLQVVLEGLLQSESFLYRPEVGDPSLAAPEGFRALSGPEVATRLSYLLVGGPPDAALLARADTLTDTDPLRETANELLARDELAGVEAFHRMWMNLERLDLVDLSASTRGSLKMSVERTLEDAFRSANVDEPFAERVFADSTAYVNGELASLYGVDATGDELAPVSLPDARGGLLTQPAMLLAMSGGLSNHPVHRGVFVLERILCREVPDPPESEEIDPALGSESTGLDPEGIYTLRERIEAATDREECASCHDDINPIGFAFEIYDNESGVQDVDEGLPVDASGAFDGLPFRDAVELSEQFADSSRVASCVATQWFRFSQGRHETSEDGCAIRNAAVNLQESGDPKEMLLAFITSPAFRLIPAEDFE